MKKIGSQFKIGVLLNYVNMILGNLIPVFYTPVMLRLLGKSEYGLYKMSSSLISYLSLISLGIGSAIARYLIKARIEKGKEEEEKFLGLFCMIYDGMAAVAVVAGIVMIASLRFFYGNSLTDTEFSRMRVLVAIMALNSSLSFLTAPQISAARSHERYIFVELMSILSTCLVPVISIILLYCGFASIGMAVSSFVINFGIRIAYTVYVRNSVKLKPRYCKFPKGILKEILMFSVWIFVATVVDKLYNTTDTILIGMVPALGTTAVAVYNVGVTFNTIVFSVSNGISSMLMPKVNKAVFSGATGAELTDMTIRVGRIQGLFFGLLASGFIVFGRPFIFYYAGADYSEAYPIAVILLIPYFIPLVQTLCLSIIVAQNKHKFRSIVYLIIAVINVVGTWFAMKKWGIIGAAAVTSIAFILGQGFVMNWFYHKKTGLNMIKFWKKISVIFIIPAVMCAVGLLLARFIDFYNIPVFIAGVIIYSVIYIVLNWFFIMNAYEKSIVTGAFSKIASILKIKKKEPVKSVKLPDYIEQKGKCCGCHACVSVCPKKCITMVQDEEGFLYPETDENLCIHCDLCKKSCPIPNSNGKNAFKPEVYAAFNSNDNIRKESTSGGIFTLLATSVLSEGGAVVGAAFTKDFTVEHIVAEDVSQLSALRSSKYMQSEIGSVFVRTKELLENGRKVLFTGTPCQVAGLRSFLKKDYDNLICQDFVCHGVPSGKLFKSYLASLRADGVSPVGVSFRDKSESWKKYSVAVEYENGDRYKSLATENAYMKAFIQNLSLRPSCYTCSFKGVDNRQSDITLADFWGIEDVAPHLHDDKGTSAVLINSEKGKDLFLSCGKDMTFEKVPIKKSFVWNPSALSASSYNEGRKDFYGAVNSNISDLNKYIK